MNSILRIISFLCCLYDQLQRLCCIFVPNLTEVYETYGKYETVRKSDNLECGTSVSKSLLNAKRINCVNMG